jgi:hypothetical protein
MSLGPDLGVQRVDSGLVGRAVPPHDDSGLWFQAALGAGLTVAALEAIVRKSLITLAVSLVDADGSLPSRVRAMK